MQGNIFSLIPILTIGNWKVGNWKVGSLLGVDLEVPVLVPAAAGDSLLQPGRGAARHPHRQHQGDDED